MTALMMHLKIRQKSYLQVKAASISKQGSPEPVNSACCLVSQHLFP